MSVQAQSRPLNRSESASDGTADLGQGGPPLRLAYAQLQNRPPLCNLRPTRIRLFQNDGLAR
jgi:hypothetical protein